MDLTVVWSVTRGDPSRGVRHHHTGVVTECGKTIGYITLVFGYFRSGAVNDRWNGFRYVSNVAAATFQRFECGREVDLSRPYADDDDASFWRRARRESVYEVAQIIADDLRVGDHVLWFPPVI